MGERKVLNKYYPPSFDRNRLREQNNIRFMLPMRLRCNRCGNYMSEGTQFNYRDEEVTGEAYLGIKIHRFHFECTNCSAGVTIKTDPKNSGYTVESGATCPFYYYGTRSDADQ